MSEPYRLTQHIPAFIDTRGGLGAKVAEIHSMADLTDQSRWPGDWMKSDVAIHGATRSLRPFHRWSLGHSASGNYDYVLMAELDEGNYWWVIGYFDRFPEALGLPEWKSPTYPAPGPPTRQQLRRQAQIAAGRAHV